MCVCVCVWSEKKVEGTEMCVEKREVCVCVCVWRGKKCVHVEKREVYVCGGKRSVCREERTELLEM